MTLERVQNLPVGKMPTTSKVEMKTGVITYQEALEKVMDNVHLLGTEEKPLTKCTGQVLAEDIHSEISLPLNDQAGPDGYALIAEDIKNASKDRPVTLRIIGSVQAGHMPKKTVERGTAMRIMTGSVIPNGADCVIAFEQTDEPGNKSGPNEDNPSTVKIYQEGSPGANITKSGSSVEKGSLVVAKGTVVGPAQISVLTTIGKATVRVTKRPIVGIISSGDELINLGQPLKGAKSYNSNTAAVAALVSRYGGIPKILGVARDNEHSLSGKIQKALDLDAIITSGGCAKGDYDLTRKVVGKMGQIFFSKINLGPGASVSFAVITKDIEGRRVKPVPVFSLAGPPVGCLLNFETFVRPALAKMIGNNSERTLVEAIAEDSVRAMRMSFFRWSRLEKINGEYRVEIDRSKKIGSLAAIASANSLTIVPAGTEINPGDKIQAIPIDWASTGLSSPSR